MVLLVNRYLYLRLFRRDRCRDDKEGEEIHSFGRLGLIAEAKIIGDAKKPQQLKTN